MTYQITQLSVSKVESFEACPRQWWFNWPQGLKPEQTYAQSDGSAGHSLIEHYLRTGEKPQGRVKLGKVVTKAIERGMFKRAPGMLTERRFSGQDKYDAEGNWIPLDPKLTPIWLGGIPWDGFIDEMHENDGIVTVEDHKFSADINAPWSVPAAGLIKTVQMPVYALVGLHLFPNATWFNLTHNCIPKNAQEDPEKRTLPIHRGQLLQRKEEITASVERMKALAGAVSQEDVPANKSACSNYGGCPHQSRCSEFKRRAKAMLTAEEAALFADLDTVKHTATTSGPPAGAAVTDGPGWVSVECTVCGMLMGKRPPGHSISPDLCPNKGSHDAAQNAAPARPAGAPFSVSAIGMVDNLVTTVGSSVSATVIAPAAVIPPDAPANSVDVAPPEKAKRKAKKDTESATPVPAQSLIDTTFDRAAAYKAIMTGTPIQQVTPTVIQFELGPQTLAVLQALIGALK